MVLGTWASIPACPLSGKKQGHLLFLFRFALTAWRRPIKLLPYQLYQYN